MRLNKRRKVILGILSIWSTIYFVLCLIFNIAEFVCTLYSFSCGWTGIFDTIVLLLPPTVLIFLALSIFYIVYLLRSNHIRKGIKVVWAVIILSSGVISLPVFWYLKIWRGDENQNQISNNQMYYMNGKLCPRCGTPIQDDKKLCYNCWELVTRDITSSGSAKLT